MSSNLTPDVGFSRKESSNVVSMLRARDACLTTYMEGPREFSTDFKRPAGSFIQVSPVLRLTRKCSNSNQVSKSSSSKPCLFLFITISFHLIRKLVSRHVTGQRFFSLPIFCPKLSPGLKRLDLARRFQRHTE